MCREHAPTCSPHSSSAAPQLERRQAGELSRAIGAHGGVCPPGSIAEATWRSQRALWQVSVGGGTPRPLSCALSLFPQDQPQGTGGVGVVLSDSGMVYG